MAQKPSIPKGTRDFSPIEVTKRNYIFSIIKSAFQSFGFQPIETPSFEKSETLLGKYGEEGDRLIFKILDSGDFYGGKVEGNVERSLTVYIALTYIFRDVVKNVLSIIKNKGEQFSSLDDFEKLSNDNELKEFVSYKIDEFVNLIGDDDYELIDIAKRVLKENRDYIVLKSLEFIRIKGLDFDIKITDEILIEWSLKWADRRLVREMSDMLFLKIKEVLPKIKNVNYLSISKDISEKALRYDLTVPFARYVVQHQNDITFPFKRYQIQPVWRADRPQKGRFREFFQCDADVVGSKSLWQEVEFVQLYDKVFSNLGLEGVTIKINNRKILSGIAEVIGAKDKLIDFTVALDKLDKIGEQGVKDEMLNKGISAEAIEKVQPLFGFSGSLEEKLSQLKGLLSTSEQGMEGISELEFVFEAIETLGLQTATLDLDITLARGLNYYTGAIFEVSAPEGVKMGSIGGGGRYDDLTGIFGLKDVSGVGISFGLDRIYLVLEELGLFPETVSDKVDVLCINFGEKEALASLKLIKTLREAGKSTELYPDNAKMKKQINYANKRDIPFVILIGEDELENNTCIVKNMIDGTQKEVTFAEVLKAL